MAAMTPPGMARTASLVREKTKKPTAAAVVAGPSLAGYNPGTGPKVYDTQRDAWANALQQMGSVYTPDPLTAVAKVAGMGLAGYGQTKATKAKEEGTMAFKKRLADTLAGTPDNNALMQLDADPYADESSRQMTRSIWERNNPTEEQKLARQRAQLELQQAQEPQYDIVTGDDGRSYYVPQQPGRGQVAPVEGFRPQTGKGQDPAGAPKTDTYKTTDEQGNPIEITREWTPEGWKEIGRAPVQKGGVNIDMSGGSDNRVFDEVKDRYAGAKAAQRGITSLREAKKAILDGAITGPFADQRLFMQQIGAAIGIADPSTIVNTQTFRAAIVPQVAAMIKATVGSTQISNTDREFAMMAAGGQIELNQETILRLLDIMERANVALIDDYQKTYDEVYPEGEGDPGVKRTRNLFRVDDPAPMQGDILRLPQDPAQAEEAYQNVPSGSYYAAPDGSIRRKN